MGGNGVNNAGLWVFTRARERDNATVAMVRKIAEEKGFDLSVLRPVTQTGCEYKSAKPAEKFAGLSVGTCPDQGYTHFVGNQTLKVPVLGKIIIEKYDKATQLVAVRD